MDFSDYTGLIPAGTAAVLQAHLRYGDGTDGVLKRTRNGDAEGLDFELTILDGQYAKQKLFWFALVVGATDGQKSMVDKNLGKLKQVIDSAKFIDPNDRSPEARAKRSLSWRDFDGLRFLAEIGVEEGKNGYGDKNIVAKVVTRDMSEWGGRPPIDQVGPGPSSGSTGGGPPAPPSSPPPAPISKPTWAS
jgi:hypothetical protein